VVAVSFDQNLLDAFLLLFNVGFRLRFTIK
jgi:hypothetical protein